MTRYRRDGFVHRTENTLAATREEILEEVAECLLSWIVDEFDTDNEEATMAQYMPHGTAAYTVAQVLDQKAGRSPLVGADDPLPLSSTAPVPAGSRQGDPLESDLAAESVRPETTVDVKEAIIEALWNTVARGLTDEEIVRRVSNRVLATPQRIRTARSEMVKSGAVVRTGTGTSSTGRQAATWGLHKSRQQRLGWPV